MSDAAQTPENLPATSTSCDGEAEFQSPCFDAEDIRRIEACVLACEGITTDDLESGIIRRMQEALVSVVPLLEEAKQMRLELATLKGDQTSVDASSPPSVRIAG